MKMNYIDFFQPNHYEESTNVFSYYFISLYLLINPDVFVKMCKKHNVHIYQVTNNKFITNDKGEIIKRLNNNETGNIEIDIPLLKSEYKNKNDLIFFILLITYLIFFYLKNKKYEK